MNSERGFESGRARTESPKNENYQSAKAQETTGKAQPQEDRKKTAKAIHVVRQQLTNEPDYPILAIILPFTEQLAPPVPPEAPSAIDIAGRVAEKVIEGVIKTAKAVADMAKGLFEGSERWRGRGSAL